MGRIEQVSVGRVAPLVRGNGEVVESAIVKRSTQERVRAVHHRLEGDEVGDPANHGGPDQAVYAYAAEDYQWWANQLGRPLAGATFGENLTTSGVDLNHLTAGTRVRAGEALLEASAPRIPCFKLAARMEDPGFIKKFAQAGRPGTYFRVIEPGELGVGDPFEIEGTILAGPTIWEVAAQVLGRPEPTVLALIRDNEYQPQKLRDWAADRLAA